MNLPPKWTAAGLCLSLCLTACKDPDVITFNTEGEEQLKIGWMRGINIDNENNKLFYAVASDDESGGTGYSQFLVKYSSDNKLQWAIPDHGFGNFAQFMFFDESADNFIAFDSNNNIFYSQYASTMEELVTQLVSPEGNILWERRIRESYYNHNSVAVTDSDTYIRKNSYGEEHSVTAYDADGNIIWEYQQQVSDKHIYEVTEMSVTGNDIYIKDPLNITRLGDSGQVISQVSAEQLDVGIINDMATNQAFIAVIGEAESVLRIALLDRNLNIVSTQPIDASPAEVADAFVAVGEDGVSCYALADTAYSEIGLSAVGAVDNDALLWHLTTTDEPDLDSGFASLHRVGDRCLIEVNQLNGEEDIVANMTHKLLTVDQSGLMETKRSTKKFMATATSALAGGRLYSAGAYAVNTPASLQLGSAAFIKGVKVD